MLRYFKSFVTDHVEHPIFASVIFFGGMLFSTGIAYETIRGPGLWTAFAAIFGIMAITVGLIGYMMSFSAKFVMGLQSSPGRGD